MKKQNLNNDIANILSRYLKIESEKSEVDKEFEKLRQKIILGLSTGDSIKDLCIIHYNTLDKSVEKPYRRVDGEISNNIGKKILVVTEVDSINGCPGTISPDYIDPNFLHITTNYILGIISDKAIFDIAKGNVTIPMKETKYLTYSNRFNDLKWSVCPRDIFINHIDMKNLGNKLTTRVTPMRNNFSEDMRVGLEIYVDDEVDIYFSNKDIVNKNNKYTEFYASGLKLLNK
ncbi:MAG: hypothetical protein ACP5N1_05715 [Candidatus Woesearchaeota archaeon]